MIILGIDEDVWDWGAGFVSERLDGEVQQYGGPRMANRCLGGRWSEGPLIGQIYILIHIILSLGLQLPPSKVFRPAKPTPVPPSKVLGALGYIILMRYSVLYVHNYVQNSELYT